MEKSCNLKLCLELALRTSSANSDANKDNLCIALLPYDLIFQMGKILSIYTLDEQVIFLYKFSMGIV